MNRDLEDDKNTAMGNLFQNQPNPDTKINLHLENRDKAPTIPICHSFLTKSCGSRQCTMHHYSMPYLWCILENDAWKPFDSTISGIIEENYCRPERRSVTVSGPFYSLKETRCVRCNRQTTAPLHPTPLADLGGVPSAHIPPQGSRFFHIDIQNF